MTIEATPPQTPTALQRLRDMREKALEGGGQKRVDAQHAKGKMTARRARRLLPRRGFIHRTRSLRHSPLQRLRDGGAEDPRGRRRHRSRSRRRATVYVFSQDFTVFGGSLSETHAEKICKVMDLALKVGVPRDRAQRLGRGPHPGGRPEPRWLRRHLLAQCPGLGGRAATLRRARPCAGGAVYSPALTDFVAMVEGTRTCTSRGPTSSRPSLTRRSRAKTSVALPCTTRSRAWRTSHPATTRAACSYCASSCPTCP